MDEMNKPKPFRSAFILSGGGTRFARYCGMYAALEAGGNKPDVLIGACGGSISAAVIQAFGTQQARLNYLQSEELFEFVRGLRVTAESRLDRLGFYCMKKMFCRTRAPHIEDVFSRYLVEMPIDLSAALPSLCSVERQTDVRTVLVGARLLFGKEDVGSLRGERKLFRKTLFTDAETAKFINLAAIQLKTDNYKHSAIDEQVEIQTDTPLNTSMRISISDMFYVPPVLFKDKYYMGGAIDLVPIELSHTLSQQSMVERKSSYTLMEEALVRAVFGYGGNERLRSIKLNTNDLEIDTSNEYQALAGHYVQKQIDWKRGRIAMTLPVSLQQWREDISAQWRYGYDTAKQALKK